MQTVINFVLIVGALLARNDTVLRHWTSHSIEALLKLVYEKYEILKRPHRFEAVFTLPYGARIHGILGPKEVRVLLEKLHLEPVTTRAETHALARFLNFRIKAVDAKGHEMVDTNSSPQLLQ